MTHEELRERITKYRTDNPVSLSKLGCIIGLDVKHRYVLTRFMKGGGLYADESQRLSDYLESRGY